MIIATPIPSLLVFIIMIEERGLSALLMVNNGNKDKKFLERIGLEKGKKHG